MSDTAKQGSLESELVAAIQNIESDIKLERHDLKRGTYPDMSQDMLEWLIESKKNYQQTLIAVRMI